MHTLKNARYNMPVQNIYYIRGIKMAWPAPKSIIFKKVRWVKLHPSNSPLAVDYQPPLIAHNGQGKMPHLYYRAHVYIPHNGKASDCMCESCHQDISWIPKTAPAKRMGV